MNVDTERRTNAVLVARSRNQAFVDIANNALRAKLIAIRQKSAFCILHSAFCILHLDHAPN
jgi:hypothetical protein